MSYLIDKSNILMVQETMKKNRVQLYCQENNISINKLAGLASTLDVPISRQWLWYHINKNTKYWPVPLAKALERATLGEIRAWELITGE